MIISKEMLVEPIRSYKGQEDITGPEVATPILIFRFSPISTFRFSVLIFHSKPTAHVFFS